MGYETLKNILDENKEQVELDKQEEMNPTRCPICNFTFDVNSKGEKACPMCEWIRR